MNYDKYDDDRIIIIVTIILHYVVTIFHLTSTWKAITARNQTNNILFITVIYNVTTNYIISSNIVEGFPHNSIVLQPFATAI